MRGDSFQLRLNGELVEVAGEDCNRSLLSWLRGRRGLTGSKEGCAEGDCGACSVVVVDEDWRGERCYRTINSCLALLPSLAGKEILTVEGIADGDELHPVQQAMVDCHGSQCGYCTPGFVASMFEGYHRGGLDREQIADQLCGNLCRCTGYRSIRQAAWESFPQAGVAVPLSEPVGSTKRYCHDGSEFMLPESLDELFSLRRQNPEALLVAGATEIGVAINKRGARFPQLISTERVAELRVITATDAAW